MGNSSRDGNTRQPYLPPGKSVCRSRSNSLDMEKLTGSKLRKEYDKTIYCHAAYLTYLQTISCGMPCWIKYKQESRLPEVSTTSDMHMIPLMAESEEELKSPLMRMRGE